jgi:hypothetical protein
MYLILGNIIGIYLRRRRYGGTPLLWNIDISETVRSGSPQWYARCTAILPIYLAAYVLSLAEFERLCSIYRRPFYGGRTRPIRSWPL